MNKPTETVEVTFNDLPQWLPGRTEVIIEWRISLPAFEAQVFQVRGGIAIHSIPNI
jgi:hypothetical protein